MLLCTDSVERLESRSSQCVFGGFRVLPIWDYAFLIDQSEFSTLRPVPGLLIDKPWVRGCLGFSFDDFLDVVAAVLDRIWVKKPGEENNIKSDVEMLRVLGFATRSFRSNAHVILQCSVVSFNPIIM